MLTSNLARKLSDIKVDIVTKRKIYEANSIQMMILSKAVSGSKELIYTVYKGSLTSTEFVELLKEIKNSILIEKGYIVKRIYSDSNNYYIFHISWRLPDPLKEIDEGELPHE